MTQLSTVCNVSLINNKTLFFSGHDNHFYDRVLSYLEDKNIQPFFLKSVDSDNY